MSGTHWHYARYVCAGCGETWLPGHRCAGPNRPILPLTKLPTVAEERKALPLCTGVLDYFPEALAEVAKASVGGNKQHDLGPLHWDKTKSTDEADALVRHLLERGTLDTDGIRHSAKVAWRALALLQREIDAEKEKP